MTNKNETAQKAALLGISLTIAASAADIDAQNMEAGRVQAYSKEDLITTLKSVANLMDAAAGTILELLDELNPEVAKMRKEIESLNKLFDL